MQSGCGTPVACQRGFTLFHLSSRASPSRCSLSLQENAMRTAHSAALLLSAAAMFTVVAHAQPPIQHQNDMLVDQRGMTLYTYDKDDRNSGKSVCNDACAKNWPPV